MNRQEILLKEYEVCQQDGSSIASTHWTVVGIFIALNTALLGGAAYTILAGKLPLYENIKWLVLMFGVLVVLIAMFLRSWLNRANFLIFTNNFRMRQIEIELGMQKNRLVDLLDNHWNDLSQEQRERFAELRNRYAPRLTRFRGLNLIYFIVILLWMFFISVSWCPFIREFILGK